MQKDSENNSVKPVPAWLEPNRLIAIVATVIIALLLLMTLLFVHLDLPAKSPESEAQTLTMDALDPEDVPEFIEPLLLEDAGDLDVMEETDPAPVPDGQPQEAPEPSNKKVVNGENPNPNPSQEKLVTTKQPSTKKTTDPTPKQEPDQSIAANMKSQFSPNNGKPGGSSTPSANSGSGGTGSGAIGTLKGGRKLLSCPLPSVTLRQKVVIKVEVYVNAQGKVTEANVLSGSSDATLREKCRQASLKATWTPQADAPRTRGVITWTLVPKI